MKRLRIPSALTVTLVEAAAPVVALGACQDSTGPERDAQLRTYDGHGGSAGDGGLRDAGSGGPTDASSDDGGLDAGVPVDATTPDTPLG